MRYRKVSNGTPLVDLRSLATNDVDFDSINDDLVRQRDSSVQTSLDNALKIKPEAHAQTIKSAKALNVPVDMAERNSNEINQLRQRNEIMVKLNKTDVLKTAFQDPDFAAVAQNDVDNLSNWEYSLRVLKNLGGAAEAGLAQAPKNINESLAAVTDLVSTFTTKPAAEYGLLPEDFLGRMSKDLRDMGEISDMATKYWREGQEGAGPTESAIYSGVESTTNMLTGLLGSIATGTPAPALTWAGIQESGRSAAEAREKGADPLTTFTYGASNALIEVGTELAPALQLLKDLKVGSSFFKTLTKQLALEIPQEQAATLLQDLNNFVVLRPEATFGDYVSERPMAAYQTLVSTIVGTGLNAGVSRGTVKLLEKMTDSTYPETLGDAPRAQQAELIENTLVEFNNLAQEIEMKKHSPEEFSQLTQKITEDSEIENVYVDGEQFFQSIEGSEVNISDLPSLEDQIEHVQEHGGDFQIPLAEYMTAIAGTDLGESLTQHARFNAEDMSAAEAKTWQKEAETRFEEQAETILKTSQEKEVIQESANKVYETVRDQITQSGRYTKDVAAKDAELHKNFAVVMANKFPDQFTNPEAVYEKYGLGVEGVQPETGIEYDQIKDVEVEVKVIEEETGRIATIKESADVALREADDNIEDMQRLITCLKG